MMITGNLKRMYNLTKNRILIENLLNEGRLEDVKAKYPGSEAKIDELSSIDPSGNNKYLNWLAIMRLQNGVSKHKLTDAINYFHNNQHKFDVKDINQFKDWKSFEEARAKAETKQSRKEIKESGADKVFENEDYLVVMPKNHQASCKYGSNTKWCITMRDEDRYFNDYTKRSPFFFVIDKKRLPNEPGLRRSAYYKIAFQFHPINVSISTKTREEFINTSTQGRFDYWNSSDIPVEKKTVEKYLGRDNFNTIVNAVNTHIKFLYGKFYDEQMSGVDPKLEPHIDILKTREEKILDALDKVSKTTREPWYQTMMKIENFINDYKKIAGSLNKGVISTEELLKSINLYDEYQDNIDKYNQVKRRYSKLNLLYNKLYMTRGTKQDQLGKQRKKGAQNRIKFRDSK